MEVFFQKNDTNPLCYLSYSAEIFSADLTIVFIHKFQVFMSAHNPQKIEHKSILGNIVPTKAT